MRPVGRPYLRQDIDRVRSVANVVLALLSALLISGCVAAQNGAGKNDLASALTPTDAKPNAASNSVKPVDQKPDTKSSLAKEASESTPSEKAVETAATKTTAADDSEKPNPPATKTTITTKPKTAKDGKKAAPKSLFAALAANNEVSTRKPRSKTTPTKNRKAVRRQGSSSALPGVRKKKTLFGILSDDNPNEDLDEPVEVVSLPSQTRRGNFGLLLQTKNVKVHCFPRKLVRILKRVERRYGRKVMVTSGYRSRAKNRRVRGAKNSIHISCAAADIQVRGVSKWKLAKYLRSVPGRGGVGTYCHTNSVHIDIGKKRDWNWRCRRKKRRRK